jgi:hypothetical protein
MDSTTIGGKTDRSGLTSENSSFMDANTHNQNTWGVSDMVRWVDGAGDKGGLPDGAGGARSESGTSLSVEVNLRTRARIQQCKFCVRKHIPPPPPPAPKND